MQDGIGNDQELLCEYLETNLNGVISAEQYGNPYGQGRINIISKDEPVTDPSEPTTAPTLPTTNPSVPTSPSTGNGNTTATAQLSSSTVSGKVANTGDNVNIAVVLAILFTSAGVVFIIRKRVKK